MAFSLYHYNWRNKTWDDFRDRATVDEVIVTTSLELLYLAFFFCLLARLMASFFVPYIRKDVCSCDYSYIWFGVTYIFVMGIHLCITAVHTDHRISH